MRNISRKPHKSASYFVSREPLERSKRFCIYFVMSYLGFSEADRARAHMPERRRQRTNKIACVEHVIKHPSRFTWLQKFHVRLKLSRSSGIMNFYASAKLNVYTYTTRVIRVKNAQDIRVFVRARIETIIFALVSQNLHARM